MPLRRLLLTACALPLLAFAAHAQEEPEISQEGGVQASTPQPPGTNWSYDGEEDNQERWGELSVDNAPCLLGLQQSPVVVSYTEIEKLPVLPTLYQSMKMVAYWRNNALELDMPPGNTVNLGDKEYTLKTIAFHSPGEHQVRDKFYYFEIEFIHKDAQGETLIISSLVDVGETPNNAFDTLLQELPDKKIEGSSVELFIDPTELMPENRAYYAYTGSLTVPPCTENVQWRIYKKPLLVTNMQMQGLAQYLGRNARMGQPLYDRVIKETGD